MDLIEAFELRNVVFHRVAPAPPSTPTSVAISPSVMPSKWLARARVRDSDGFSKTHGYCGERGV